MMDATAQTSGVVVLTEAAAAKARVMALADPAQEGKPLRIYVEGGGCAGMQYGLVFDEERPDDAVSQQYGVTVVVDAFSAAYLRGAVVDFKDGLDESGFKISNPNARESCGCGKSFGA